MKYLKKLTLCFFSAIIVYIGINIYNDYINQKQVMVLGNLIYIEADNDEKKQFYKNRGIIETTYQNTAVMSCVDENNKFISVGHSIANGRNITGSCYKAKSYDVNKSNDLEIGSIEAHIDTTNEIGKITENTSIGVVGDITNNIKNGKKMNLATRFQIHKGMASLYINYLGKSPKQYDVEITGVNCLSLTKNIKLKIVDEDLISMTGGAVPGMSGTPVIQDGNVIGILNCVNENNSKEAYAVSIDKFF